jgi:hypothetical protein
MFVVANSSRYAPWPLAPHWTSPAAINSRKTRSTRLPLALFRLSRAREGTSVVGLAELRE